MYQKFREEDKQLSSTQAFMRRSDSLRRVWIFFIISVFFSYIAVHSVRLWPCFNSLLCSFNQAEEKAREESEKLKQQEAEQITEKRRRDLVIPKQIFLQCLSFDHQ